MTKKKMVKRFGVISDFEIFNQTLKAAEKRLKELAKETTDDVFYLVEIKKKAVVKSNVEFVDF